MELTELRKRISESSSAEWFKSIQHDFNFPYINFKKRIEGFSAIFEFVTQQKKGWEKLSESFNQSEVLRSKTFFQDLENKLTSFIDNYLNQDTGTLVNYWRNSIADFSNNQSPYIFTYNCQEIEFLLKISEDYSENFRGAYDFLIKQINYGQFSDRNYFIGTLLAYEFILKDNSQILERRETEKKSLNSLRSIALKYIDETEKDTLEKIQNTNKKFKEYTEKIDTLKSEKEELFNDWFNASKEDFNTFDEGSKEKLKLLEETYKNKLRLDGPAKYWKDRAEKLKAEGRNHLYLLVVLVIFSGILIFLTLYLTPDMILHSFFEQDKSIAIRWSIMYFIFIGFLAFGIRVLTKIVLSSFHLSRDAEEREHLSFFFLSLAKETQIEKEERLLILQSLFSRADTGLLKDDSAPTMPGTSDILKALNK